MRATGAVAVLAFLGLASCATLGGDAGVQRVPAETVFQSLLGGNPGLTAVRATVEARLSFGGRKLSLPGVLLLDTFGGFRLELLDPLDRPLAIFFVEDGRIVQYRPALRLAASLGVFPESCRGVDPADWVAAITASSLGPVAGERLADRGLWGGERSLERYRGGELRQSVRYNVEEGELRPRLVSWYCEEETILQLRLRDWVRGSRWRLPSRIDVDYPGAGLEARLELHEIEGNPDPTGQPLRPRLGADVGWTSWKLPR